LIEYEWPKDQLGLLVSVMPVQASPAAAIVTAVIVREGGRSSNHRQS